MQSDTEVDDLLVETEALLKDISFVWELFPVEEGDTLLSAVADMYIWLKNKRFATTLARGCPRISISVWYAASLYKNNSKKNS